MPLLEVESGHVLYWDDKNPRRPTKLREIASLKCRLDWSDLEHDDEQISSNKSIRRLKIWLSDSNPVPIGLKLTQDEAIQLLLQNMRVGTDFRVRCAIGFEEGVPFVHAVNISPDTWIERCS